MSEAMEIIRRAKEIRARLINPPNAIRNNGDRIPFPHPQVPEFTRVSLEPPIPETIMPDLNGSASFNSIIQAVSDFTEVPIRDILGKSRKPNIIIARHIFFFIALRYSRTKSYSAIGRWLRMDHSSIMHGSKKVQNLVAVDEEMKKKVLTIATALVRRHEENHS